MKKVIEKILTGKQLDLNEITEFIVNYVESESGKPPTGKEIEGILKMIQKGIFNLPFAAKKYADTLGLTIVSVEDVATRRVLKTNVYE